MADMMIFLYIITVFISIFTGFVLFKGYTLIKNCKKEEENLTHLHSKIKELENGIIQPMQNKIIDNHNNGISNKRYNLPTPKIILDNKVYS